MGPPTETLPGKTPPAAAPCAAAGSARALVEASLGPRDTVSADTGLAVPGLEFFWISLATGPAGVTQPGLDAGYGVVVPAGAVAPLRGKPAMQAVWATGLREPVILARAALLLLEQGGAPLTEADSVSPPALEAGVLTYTSEFRRVGRPQRITSQVAVDTWTVRHPEPARDPVAEAQAQLASGNESATRAAVDQLAAACGDPRVPPLLAQALTEARWPPVRRAAARALGRCPGAGGAEVLAVLVERLKHDPDPKVRMDAAEALGDLKDPAARGPLEETLAGDPHPDARGGARRALSRLP